MDAKELILEVKCETCEGVGYHPDKCDACDGTGEALTEFGVAVINLVARRLKLRPS
jgi:DnaJ-class molecular chaperone